MPFVLFLYIKFIFPFLIIILDEIPSPKISIKYTPLLFFGICVIIICFLILLKGLFELSIFISKFCEEINPSISIELLIYVFFFKK